MPNGHEIEYELTFLARKLPPEIRNIQPKQLKDIYFPEDMSVHSHLRLRQKGDKYEITKKEPLVENDSSAQSEITIPLDDKEYENLSIKSNRSVSKDRYQIVIDGYPAEIDVFKGNLEGLVLIDFEFKTIEEKDSFKTPNICLADVTQEEFIAGGILAGKSYSDIEPQLSKYGYRPISV